MYIQHIIYVLTRMQIILSTDLSALTEALDVLLQVALLLLAVDAGQVHAVEPAVLLRLVPVGLQKCHFSHLCFCVYGLTI